MREKRIFTGSVFLFLSFLILALADCAGGGGGGGGDGSGGSGGSGGTLVPGVANSVSYKGGVSVVGYTSHGSKQIATYWKNGKRTSLSLPADTPKSSAESVFVNCSPAPSTTCKTYIVGYYTKSNKRVPFLWNNGTLVDLSISSVSGANQATATGVDVSGDNAYISGYYKASSLKKAVYWEYSLSNGTQTLKILRTMSGKNSSANGIAVYGGHVYSVGYAGNNSLSNGACYWIDTGYRYYLSTKTSFGTDIMVYGDTSNSSFRISGTKKDGGDDIFGYWQGFVGSSSSDHFGNSMLSSNSIDSDGSSVIYVGFKNSRNPPTIQTAAFTHVEGGGNYISVEVEKDGVSEAKSVTVVSASLAYMAGYKRDGTNDYPCYWKLTNWSSTRGFESYERFDLKY